MKPAHATRTVLVGTLALVQIGTELHAKAAGPLLRSTASAAGQPDTGGETSAVARLRSLSALQLSTPARWDPSLPPPLTLNPSAFEPAGTGDGSTGSADAAATRPLADALAELAKENPAGDPLSFPSPTPASMHLRAVQAYVRGRSELLSGDPAAATSNFETATRLDPQVAEPWLALAEAQLAQGKRLSAIVSFQQAARRGSGQSRALWFLGRDALHNGKPRLASQYLSRARSSDPGSSDAALPFLIDTDLSEALELTENVQAACEALQSALALPDQFGAPTRLRNELADLYRRRGELWRKLGDLRARLGDASASLGAYSEAEKVPMLDPGSVLPRRVRALLQLGRPAEAGLAIIGAVERAGWFADERSIAMCGYMTKHAELGTTFADAIDEITKPHLANAPPSQSASLARLRAASAKDPVRVRELLREATSNRPTDPGSIAHLIASLDPSPASIADGLVALIESTHATASSTAEGLLAATGDVDAVVAELERRPTSSPAILLRATILERTSRPRAAAALLKGHAWAGSTTPEGLRTCARVAMKNGEFSEAETAMAALRAWVPQSESQRVEAARAITATTLDLQQPAAALAAAESLLLEGDRPRPLLVDDLLLAATATLMMDRREECAAYLRRAILADRFDERGYEGLLRVYAPPGERADNDRIGEVARELRQSLPSARVLRLLTAQESVQRQLDVSAEDLLQGLVDERLSDATAGSALVSVWESRAAAARSEAKAASAVMPDSVIRGEAWLRQKVADRPEHAWLWTGLARMLTVRGNPEEAEQLLASRQQIRPWPQFGQMRETILRDWLAKPSEYAEAVRVRLEPAPRGIDESLELAELLAGQKKTADAIDVLSAGLPAVGGVDAPIGTGLVLTQDQSARFVGLLLRVAREWDKKPRVTDESVPRLFDVASTYNVALPAALHEFRLRALVTQPTPNQAAITRALAEACARNPGQAPAFYAAVAASHLQAGRGKDALPFLRSAVSTSPSPSPDLLFALVQQTAVAGDANDFELALDQLTNPEHIARVLRVLNPDDTPPTGQAELRGQLAYRIGTLYSWLGRDELSTQAKREALRLNPGLAWAKNDLGYQLLESGGDFEEAARLIEEAYTALPNEPSIIDSIGWIRYHQGVLVDQPASGDRPMVEGAVTLLKKAVETGTGKKNGTLHDHLAESLWAAGNRDEAKEVWTKAEALLSEDVNLLKDSSTTPAAALTRANKELDGVRGKRRAAAEGTEPILTPMRSAKQAQLK